MQCIRELHWILPPCESSKEPLKEFCFNVTAVSVTLALVLLSDSIKDKEAEPRSHAAVLQVCQQAPTSDREEIAGRDFHCFRV